jgi:hypothetical protein
LDKYIQSVIQGRDTGKRGFYVLAVGCGARHAGSIVWAVAKLGSDRKSVDGIMICRWERVLGRRVMEVAFQTLNSVLG